MMTTILKNKLKELLHLNDSPQKIAMAFAVGVFIAFSPMIGFHTAMVFLAAWVFRLNLVALFIGAFVNNPWTLAPLYGLCLWFGISLYGGISAFPDVSWKHQTFITILKNLKPYIGPFFLGTTILGIVFAVLSYFLIFFVIRQLKKSKSEISV